MRRPRSFFTPLAIAVRGSTPDGKQLIFVLQNPAEPSDGSAWQVSTEGDGPNTSHTPVALPWGKHCCIDWKWIDGGKEFLYLRSSGNGPPVLGAITMSNGHLNRPVERAELPVNIGKISDFTFDDQNNLLYLLNAGKSRGEVLRIGPTKSTYEVMLPGIAADEISYSRDGRWMTFVTPSDYTLWRSRSDGSDALQLSKPTWQAELSAWSPDGHTIAYMGKAPGRPWRIFIIDRNGGPQREAAPGGGDNQGAPSWSPDGKTLAYGNVLCQETQTCWIREIDLRTGTVTRLPGSRGLRTVRFSPDGRFIAALQPEKHELVLFDTSAKTWTMLAGSVTGDNINWSADSRFVFVDKPRTEHPIIEKIRVADGHRFTVADLTPVQRMPGAVSPWFGLSPDGSPILLHYYTASEIYTLSWNLN